MLKLRYLACDENGNVQSSHFSLEKAKSVLNTRIYKDYPIRVKIRQGYYKDGKCNIID